GGERGDVLGQHVRISRIAGEQDLFDPGDLRRRLRRGLRVFARAGDERVDRPEPAGRTHGRQRRVADGAGFVFDQDQRRHATTPSVLSFATSSSTEATFTPAWRTGGSSTFSTVRRGVTSTPVSATGFTASGFDLAF